MIASDPWRVDDAVVPGGARSTRAGRLFLAWALALIGPLARVWDDGTRARAGSIAMALAAGLLVGALGIRRGWWWRAVAVGASVVAGLVLTHWTIGRAPVLVSSAAAVVGTGALVEWRPWPTHPGRSAPLALGALAPVVAAEAVWFRTGRIVPTAVLLALAVGVLEAYHRAEGPTRAMEARAARLANAVASWIGAAAIFVVAIPLMWIPGAIGRIPRGGPAAPRWSARSATVVEQRQDAASPFSGADPGSSTRTRQQLLGVVVTAALVAGLIVYVRTRPADVVRRSVAGSASASGASSDPLVDQEANIKFVDLPATRGLDYANAVRVEQKRLAGSLVPDAITGSHAPDTSTRYTNVRDGVRRSIAAPRCSCRSLSVWFVGGSSGFGLGQRDSGTVASQLVRIGAAHGLSITITNLATPGWTIWQEYLAIEHRLASGAPRPDLVLFYDGANDVAGTLFSSTVHGMQPDQPTLMPSADMTSLYNGGHPTFGSSEQVDELGRLAAARYRGVATTAIAQLGSMGVATAFYFQPDAFASVIGRQTVHLIYRDDPRVTTIFAQLGQALEVASTSLADLVVDLRHSLDDVPTPVFVDTIHTNEAGAQIVAEDMFTTLGPRLSKLPG